MPLLGQHTQNPDGDPNVIAGLQALAARAKAGDASATALIQKVASGQPVNGADLIPGWNVGMVSWGKAPAGQDPTHLAITHQQGDGVRYWGDEAGRQAESAAAQNLLKGGDDSAQLAAANASHKDWTGGTLAQLAPIAAAFIPGVGPLAAGAIGAGIGGAEAAGGVTNQSVLGGAATGAAEAGAAGAAKSAIGNALAGTGSVGNALAGVSRLAGMAGGAAALPSVARAAIGGGTGQPGTSAGGSGISDLSQLIGTLQGGSQVADAASIRKAAIASAQQDYNSRAPLRTQAISLLSAPERTATDLSSIYANTDNPFAKPGSLAPGAVPPVPPVAPAMNPAMAAANAALTSRYARAVQ